MVVKTNRSEREREEERGKRKEGESCAICYVFAYNLSLTIYFIVKSFPLLFQLLLLNSCNHEVEKYSLYLTKIGLILEPRVYVLTNQYILYPIVKSMSMESISVQNQ